MAATDILICCDWLGIEEADSSPYYLTAYRAERIEGSGPMVSPFVTREVADTIVEDQVEGSPDVLSWDGDTLVCTGDYVGDDDTVRVEPDADGLYDVGFGWVWDVLDHPSDALDIRGTPVFPLLTPTSNGLALIIESPTGLVATMLDHRTAEAMLDAGVNYEPQVYSRAAAAISAIL